MAAVDQTDAELYGEEWEEGDEVNEAEVKEAENGDVNESGNAEAEEEDSDDGSDDSDDDIEIITERDPSVASPQARRPGFPTPSKPTQPGAPSTPTRLPVQSEERVQLDLDAVPQINGKEIFDVDLDGFADKPWRKPGAVPSDYFNYGFVESTWRIYAQRQSQLRQEYARSQPGAMMAGPGFNMMQQMPQHMQPQMMQMPQPIPQAQPRPESSGSDRDRDRSSDRGNDRKRPRT